MDRGNNSLSQSTSRSYGRGNNTYRSKLVESLVQTIPIVRQKSPKNILSGQFQIGRPYGIDSNGSYPITYQVLLKSYHTGPLFVNVDTCYARGSICSKHFSSPNELPNHCIVHLSSVCLRTWALSLIPSRPSKRRHTYF